jgi:hypothetical protein
VRSTLDRLSCGRLRLAEVLETLSMGRRVAVRGVADPPRHLALVPTATTWQMLAAAPRARFNPNRIDTLMAVRAGSVATSEIVQSCVITPRIGRRLRPWTPATRCST